MPFEQLKLENQLCFPLYAASRLVIRAYQEDLDKLGISYPQYLVLMVLWQTDGITVNEIADKLILNTNTITPLLKRMEQMGLITRLRTDPDKRKVLITITKKGAEMQNEAQFIPFHLIEKLRNTENPNIELLKQLKENLEDLIRRLLPE
jgi:MarR family transcriptional regulator, organic hydroperoxide resistance regulator